jgi:aryl-alcohol dehydrogenase-like predicted oxidoreductase
MVDSTTMMRTLGRSGIPVSAVGLGCWAIGGDGWVDVHDDESIRGIQRAFDLGVTLYDTANGYGAGHSERILGKALAGKRQQVLIATKFTYDFDEETGEFFGERIAPDEIRSQCEASLRRLNTDYIDLYQFHWNELEVERAGEVRDTLDSLVQEGKIRYYGWSTDFVDRAQFFGERPGCTAIQLEMNVIDDAPAMTAYIEEANLAGLNRGPLAMGLLTGKYTASSKMHIDDVRGENAPEWMKYFKDGKPNPEWLGKVDAIRQILTHDGRTLAQGALSWLLTRSPQMLPIPGFRTVAQVEENCKTLQLPLLTQAQMDEIDAILERPTKKVAAG